MQKSLNDLSQTVAENSKKIEALAALPSALEEHGKLLQGLLNAVQNNGSKAVGTPDNTSTEGGDGGADPIENFMQEVLNDKDCSGTNSTLFS